MTTEGKTHWKKLTNPKYIGAHDVLPAKEFTAKIIEVKKEMVTGSDGSDSECVVCSFKKAKKQMILNKTNLKIISNKLKTPYIEEWAGCEVTVYVTKIRAFGETVDALRIKA